MKRSRIVVLVAAVLTAGLAVRLGLWQLDRAGEKNARHDAMVARERLPPLDGTELARSADEADAQQFRRVAAVGHWVAQRTVFLDNRQMDRRTGFFVVTPLRLDGSDRVVLVQRGFTPRRFDERTALPAVPTPAGGVRVDGLIGLSPSRLYDFGPGPGAAGPIRQNLDLDAYALETGLPILPVTILQSDAGAPVDGLVRHWPAPDTGVQTHYGYAFQWFTIAGVIAFLYVWFQLVRRRPQGG